MTVKTQLKCIVSAFYYDFGEHKYKCIYRMVSMNRIKLSEKCKNQQISTKWPRKWLGK